LSDENIMQTKMSFLPTASLLQTLPVSKIWYQSVRFMDTWIDSCGDKKAFQALQQDTGMDARMIACGLRITSRDLSTRVVARLNPQNTKCD